MDGVESTPVPEDREETPANKNEIPLIADAADVASDNEDTSNNDAVMADEEM